MGKTYLSNYENGTTKSLYDSLSFIKGLLEDLSRDYSTPIKR